MSKKDQFMAFVFLGAVSHDINADSSDSQLVMRLASEIPNDAIPDNVMNAAKVFLAFCSDVRKRPHRWMLARK
jgi:hypothetical protein